MLQTITAPSFAAIVAFYGEPLPHEAPHGYMQAVCAAKLAALRTVMGEPAIAWHAPVQSVLSSSKSAVAPRKAVAKVKRMSAEQFFDAFQVARRAVSAALGEHWVIKGAGRWATVPNGWRSFTGPRGGKVRLPKDIRVPGAEYWPGGVLPAELVLAEPSPPLAPWVVGYGRDGEPVLMHPIARRLQEMRADAMAEFEARKAASADRDEECAA